MKAIAALTTGKGSYAIAAVELAGNGSREILNKIFKPAKADSLPDIFPMTIYGRIYDGQKVIDDVIISSFDENHFEINCHGNAVIISKILKLLEAGGAEITDAGDILKTKPYSNTIEAEVNMCAYRAVTLAGFKMIHSQATEGLIGWISKWKDELAPDTIDSLNGQASWILKKTDIAEFIINGCRVVLAGPPNSGKSTLLNCLAGRDKAIVSDIEGTTRDWISARCLFKNMLATVIDTAGLEESLLDKSEPDKAARNKSKEMIDLANLILLVLDGTHDESQSHTYKMLWHALTQHQIPVIAVYNKCDIADSESNGLAISALKPQGIDKLISEVRDRLGVSGFDISQPICFTDRQRAIVNGLSKIDNMVSAEKLFDELLNGQI